MLEANSQLSVVLAHMVSIFACVPQQGIGGAGNTYLIIFGALQN